MLTNTPIRLCLSGSGVSSNAASPRGSYKDNFLPELNKSIKLQKFHPFTNNEIKNRQQQLKSLPEIKFKPQTIKQSQSMGQLDEMHYDRVQIIKNKKKTAQKPKQTTNIKYEYSDTTHPNKELHQEPFAHGFLSARIRNDIQNNQQSKDKSSLREKQSDILLHQMAQSVKTYQKQSIIQQAWQTHYSPIYPTKTSQSERKKKYKRIDIINKSDVKASNAIQDIQMRVIREKEKDDEADKKSQRARKLYKMYNQYF